MERPRTAVHHTIVVVDVEGFGDRRRTNPHQVGVRQGLYRAVRTAFDAAGVPWENCYHEDRGDAVFVLAPASVPKSVFVGAVPYALSAAVREHNESRASEQRIRLRMGIHAGEVNYDEHGVTSASLNLAFRLVDAQPLKAALVASPGVLALITSVWFFEDVVRHTPAANPDTYRQVRVKEKETSTVAWISLPDHPYPPDPGQLDAPPPAGQTAQQPRQLPAAMPSFTGRATELATLTAALDAMADRGATMVISALAGAGGIGKTWLAVQWARQNVDRFPDGQLFVDLRGFSPDDPLSAATAVRGFLDALGVDTALLPTDPHAQLVRYRELLADKRILIVLDNAADTAHVTPLLPENSTCTVLVTSRRHLHGLVTRYGAYHLNLDVLSDTEAHAMLAARLGSRRAAAQPDAVKQLLTYCGGFPLALSIVASYASTRPHLSMDTLANELHDLGIDALDTDDPMASVRAVLSWSTTALSPEHARALGLLGIAPGPDISLPAAAQLTGLPIRKARAVLRSLEEMSLLTQDISGRYRMHDLIRHHATQDPRLAAEDRDTALRRVVDFYLHTANAADQLLRSLPNSHPVGAPGPGCHPLAFPDRAVAWEWFAAEHECLLAGQQAAAAVGWHQAVWQLASVLVIFHYWRGYSQANLTMWRAAVAAADRLGEPQIQVYTRQYLGDAFGRLGRSDETLDNLRQAFILAEQTRDRHGQAHIHRSLARAWAQRADRRQAFEHSTRALDLFRSIGDTIFEGIALDDLGWYAARLGMYDEGRAHCEAALALCRQERNLHGVANALSDLGYIAHHTDQYTNAVDYYQQAIALHRDLGDFRRVSESLDDIGSSLAALGRHEEAQEAWREALGLYKTQQRTEDAERVQRQMNGQPERRRS